MNQYALSQKAKEDFVSIYRFIAKTSVSRADQYIAELDETLLKLASSPLIGPISDLGYDELRSFVFRSHKIFYFPAPNGIHVIRVLHSKRNINYSELID